MRVSLLEELCLVTSLLFLFSIPLTVAAPEGTCPNESLLNNMQQRQFIVRFNEYQDSSYWKREIERVMARASFLWEWVERQNAAASFPTDFGVIRLNNDASDQIKELLKHAAFVKDIHPDRVLHRNLSVEEFDVGVTNDATNDGMIVKPPGRFRTRPTFGLDSEDDEYTYDTGHLGDELKRKLLYGRTHSVTGMLHAEKIWELGFTGEGIKVGVFDTGIKGDHPHIKNIKERTNWTHQKTLSDGLGHGSFVAGVIAGSNQMCHGLAPDVELYTFKVFTDDQVSYTSWFMDAFNYAILSELDIVNLSIGGPDYLDQPFVEKTLEVTSSGIIMISAIGNDGPLMGTLNNPADQNDVIGIGGIDYSSRVARFSSRGMSTWELPLGYGRIKPDVMAYGQDVSGSKMDSGCRTLSGTSVASPVAAGAVALLASTVPREVQQEILNPASMKQALVHGADRLPEESIYVQGAGKINLSASMQFLQSYEPHASLIPRSLDLTDCPYMWPFCTQPLYAHAIPIIINGTVLNGLAVTGTIDQTPEFVPTNDAGQFVTMAFEYSDVLWPWTGYLAIYIRVSPEASDFSGIASGEIRFSVVSPPVIGTTAERRSDVVVPFMAEIIPTPTREKRVLWDQFHSIKYPPGYFPRDSLDVQKDILDWHGDHPHTNFHDMYDELRHSGFFLEILGSPFTCFNASQYGALLIVDSEDVFYPEEITKLKDDVENKGLGLVVFAEWYNVKAAESYKFFDDNTRSWWTPYSGGGNIPGLNELLAEYGIAFGDAVLKGKFMIADGFSQKYASGADIVHFPAGGFLHGASLEDIARPGRSLDQYFVLGLTDHGKGRIAVYGDTSCLDSTYARERCDDLLGAMLDYVNHKDANPLLNPLMSEERKILTSIDSDKPLPQPMPNKNFTDVSFVLTHPLQCYKNSPMGENTQPEDPKKEELPVNSQKVVQSVAVEPKASEKPDGGRIVAEIVDDAHTAPDDHHPQTVLPSKTENVEESFEMKQNSTYQLSQSPVEWTPPLRLSKWSALFGLFVMFGLYKMTRRRRQPSP